MSDSTTDVISALKRETTQCRPGILPPGKSMKSLIGHTVVNISDSHLTKHQIEAPEKGLTFSPTPGPPNKSLIWIDFKDFHRRLVLKHHFYNDNQLLDQKDLELVQFLSDNLDDNENPLKKLHAPFRNKSNWKPTNTHISLNVFKQAFKTSLLHSKIKHKSSDNLTKLQRNISKELCDNPEIVIKEADKGSAVVVMNTKDYLREGYRQLGDNAFYTQITKDPTNEVSEKITNTLVAMRNKDLITEENLDFLSPTNCTIGHFYLLPKIHKKNIPGRPICSSVTHPTVNISKFVDAHIKEYVPKTKSYIRDTQDFISKIKQLGKIPEGAFLVTLDVSSLYTNIPNQEGICAVADQHRKDPTKMGISNYILDLLKLVLHNMYFEFNGDYYLQTGGTAMGTSLAPNYANLFMDKFETTALANYPLKPLIWKRFINDIFMVWTHGENQLHKFVEYLNGIHQTIKFIHEASRHHSKNPTKQTFIHHTIHQTNRHPSIPTIQLCTPT